MISPGPVEIPILEGRIGQNTNARREQFKTLIPMTRPGGAAAPAVFLASDDGGFIAIDLPVDGGRVAVACSSTGGHDRESKVSPSALSRWVDRF